MLRSNRGAARVSVIWIISVGVVAMATTAFAFISQSDIARERNLVSSANDARDEATASFEALDGVRREQSKMLGWYDRSSADPKSDLEQATAALADLRLAFPDIGATDADFESVLPTIKASHQKLIDRIATLEGDVAGLRTDVASAQAAAAQVTQDKDSVISQLRQQLADDNQNYEQRQSDLEARLADANETISDQDSTLREASSQHETERVAWAKKELLLEARNSSLREDLRFQTPEFASNTDGEILSVSTRLPLAWVNIGANQRLTKGTAFTIRGGPRGSEATKGWGVILSVKADSAEMKIESLDSSNPVAVGDEIVNPLYDPEGQRVAVLAGSFSGAYSREALTATLARIGIEVREELDQTTHFLIVGNALFNDPDTNERLEEPLQPQDLAVYKQAESQQIQIVPLDNVRQFISPGS